MQIQQAIIVIMLPAVICIFVGMITQSLFPSDGTMDVTKLFPTFARTSILGFVLIPWVIIVCVTDLYIGQSRLQQDMATYMACN